MNLKNIIYEIREQYKLMSDDAWPNNEFIASLVNKARSAVMQQRYSDPRNIVQYSEYQTVPLTVGSNAITTEALPTLIKTTGMSNSAVKIYTSTELSIPLNVVSIDRLPYVGFDKFTSDFIYCALSESGHVVFNSKNQLYKLIDSVYVRGLYDDPEAAYYAANPGSTTDFWDTEYPISGGVLLDVRKIVDKKMEQFIGETKDTLNDATEERFTKGS